MQSPTICIFFRRVLYGSIFGCLTSFSAVGLVVNSLFSYALKHGWSHWGRLEVGTPFSGAVSAGVLEGSQQAFWDWNIATGEVQRNERWAGMLGDSLKYFAKDTDTWTRLLHPEDRDAAWDKLEEYLSRHSHAEFSHGICPNCFAKVIEETG